MNNLMSDKVVLITGAALGIGRAIAQAAADAGAKLVLGDVAQDGLAELGERLEQKGVPVSYRVCDVREQADLDALVELARVRFGVPDVVYANAGVEGPLASPDEYSEADFLSVIDVNINGVWRTIKATLPGMKERGTGSIVATASVAGLVGAAGLPAYVASKHGVVGLVRSTAISAAKTGVRVNAVCPGMVETGMVDRLTTANPEVREGLLALKPMGRMGATEEIASAAIWLGSEQASFVTGHALAVDGGYVAQ